MKNYISIEKPLNGVINMMVYYFLLFVEGFTGFVSFGFVHVNMSLDWMIYISKKRFQKEINSEEKR